MSASKGGTTTPSLSQLQSSLASLTTVTHILDGFAHRNKNQHRGSKWWAPFDMLRRNLHKILPDLDGAIQRTEILSSSIAAPSSKRRKTADGAAKAVKQPELDRVVERATWVRDVLGLRAYETFTQLMADQQFAQLGLVLVGVLAQVETAISPFVKAQPQPEPEPGNEPKGQAARPVRGPGADARGEAVPRAKVSSPAISDGGGELDVGVAVSRDELEDQDVQPSIERESSPVHTARAAKQDHHLAKVKSKKLQKPTSEGPMKDREPKAVGLSGAKMAKKKKKKKGGDEFDDLFSSLL